MPLVADASSPRAIALGAPKVAVVNEAFVRHFIGNRDPIGVQRVCAAATPTSSTTP